MKKYLTLLDMDGAVVDSCGECYNRTREAWPAVVRKDYPLTEEQFRGFRPLVLKVEDFFALTMLLAEEGGVPDDYAERRAEYQKRFGSDPAVFKEAFYAMRDRIRAEDIERWMGEQALYEGVPEMMGGLCALDGMGISVVTSKDRGGTNQLLEYHGLLPFIGDVISRDDVRGGRREQFGVVLQRNRGVVDAGKMAVYDDMAENLGVAKDMGMFPIAAPQGYDFSENITPFPMASPIGVPDLVRVEFKIR